MNEFEIAQSVYQLDGWLQSMRQIGGYGGPISHWWESCLVYCGPMIDWRYEGLVLGYLNLYRQTKSPVWRERLLVAAEDIIQGKLPNKNFRNSNFQIGPISGGTPHEAAVDVALLELTRFFREEDNHVLSDQLLVIAEANLMTFQIGQLWNGQGFADQPNSTTLVPNKNGTTLTALLLYEEITGRAMGEYIGKAVEVMLSAQVLHDCPQKGGIVHLGTGAHRLAIGIYTARTAVALARLYKRDPKPEYRQKAQHIIAFLVSLIQPKGTDFGYYPDGSLIVCPRWISPSADLLQALVWWQPYCYIPEGAIDALMRLLCQQQMETGGFPTAHGLGRKGARTAYTGLPDFRDVLPVVGWCDKVLYALSHFVSNPIDLLDSTTLGRTELACQWRGKRCTYVEDAEQIQLHRGTQEIYFWKKQQCYPSIYRL